MKTHIIITSLALTISCGQRQDSREKNYSQVNSDTVITVSSSIPPVSDQFALYLNNFKRLNLPLTIKGCLMNVDTLKEFDGEMYAEYNQDYSYALGQIYTDGSFTALLTLGVADCYLPVLSTYKLNGDKIDEKTLAIGGCGSGCGFSCEEFMTIRRDFTIYTSDTISTYECDSLGLEIQGSYEFYVIYKEGKITSTGMIELTEEKKKILPGRKADP